MRNFSFFSILSLLVLVFQSSAQNPALIGYWHNWQDANAPYLPLDQVDARYNVINVSFAVPQAGTDYKLVFIPDQVSPATLITQIQSLQAQGRKVNISIGGANGPVILHNAAERDTFEVRLLSILNYYGFDGIDIDLEGASVTVTGGTLYTPIDQPVINLITAVKLVMQNYRILHQKKLYLSMAPETAFVQGGKSAFSGIWGAYLPVIQALRDSLDILHVQLYNSGSMIALDNNTYTQGTADFIVAMTEMVIQGFSCSGGTFFGLPASKIAVGLPACPDAAGGGYADTSVVGSAIRYLKGVGPQPGIYNLIHWQGYPNLRGMMTWSINWDATSNCGSVYEYASIFQSLFLNTTEIKEENKNNNITIIPNPASEEIKVRMPLPDQKPGLLEIYNTMGHSVLKVLLLNHESTISLRDLPAGVYYLKSSGYSSKLVKISEKPE